jgi:hypothetical protein
MDYVLNNLWCSNSKNICVPMFIPILYVVFEHFLSKLIILHDQSMYDVHKLMTIICMIFF